MVQVISPGGRFMKPGCLRVLTLAWAWEPLGNTVTPLTTTSWATLSGTIMPSCAASEEMLAVSSTSIDVKRGTFTSMKSGCLGSGGGAEADGACTMARITLSERPAVLSFWRAPGVVSNSQGEDLILAMMTSEPKCITCIFMTFVLVSAWTEAARGAEESVMPKLLLVPAGVLEIPE